MPTPETSPVDLATQCGVSPEEQNLFLRLLKGETRQELFDVNRDILTAAAMLGFRFYENGRLDEAERIFLGLVGIDPTWSYAQTAMGAVHMAKDNLDDAVLCFTEAIKHGPDEIPAYANRGEIYLRQGKLFEAAADFKKCVELDPELKDPLTKRARALAAAALQNIQKMTAGNAAKQK